MIDISNWTNVQKTLLIPLIGRALAKERHPELGFYDPIAEEIIAQLDLKNYQGIVNDKHSVWGSIIRSKVFDEQILKFLKSENNVQVINIGCGFCTRAWRLKNAFNTQTKWIEWDFPEVIQLKRQHFPTHENIEYRQSDLNTHSYLMELINKPSHNTLVVMEGVLMFLSKKNAQNFLNSLKEIQVPALHLLLDYIGSPILRISNIHPSLKDTKAQYTFAMSPLQKKLPRHITIAEDKLFTQTYTGWLKYLNIFLRKLFGRTLYDVALLKVQNTIKNE